jgi:PIN domain nuclease of toxin-antitoxin system
VKLLADTQILLRAAIDPQRLSAAATAFLIDPENDLFFSAASIWEVALKSALGRADFQVDAGRLQQGLIEAGYGELPIAGAHGVAASRLPSIHKDPFDRILIAQAAAEEMLLLTTDLIIAKYQGPIRLV